MGVVAESEQHVRGVLEQRYGDAVGIDWVSTEDTRVVASEWQRYDIDESGMTLGIHYLANPFVPFERADVTEDDDRVTVTVLDRTPVGGVPLPATIRSVTAQLARPLGGRQVFDGTTGRLREPI